MLAAFYLEGEANQWWQWLKKGYHIDNVAVTWIIFEKELLLGVAQQNLKIMMNPFHVCNNGAP
jgi:hypothetical protein